MASWWNSARDSLSALAEKANDMDLGGAMSTLKKDLGEFASTIKVRKSDTHVKRVCSHAEECALPILPSHPPQS